MIANGRCDSVHDGPLRIDVFASICYYLDKTFGTVVFELHLRRAFFILVLFYGEG